MVLGSSFTKSYLGLKNNDKYYDNKMIIIKW